MGNLIPLTQPGEYLAEILDELGITAYRLAKETKVPRDRISHIIRGTRVITPDTALRLGRYFGQSPQFWLRLQVDYDLRKAQREIGAEINAEVEPYKACL
ncbi:MAG: addiction module antidote protein, HigA family [Candidatus Lambdaproteobacteria bacterium RIFOXYD1_FULL_56_27]|uniref:Addiction module antidote protein, HigA family n=1 Tax=Candidatus Lambdaproteobacteria bacterium RIFOXYD2_FULL_56_26 TaxID=1817773 RepID=A0A1F6GUF7_9PROT|nr:MAG: addiction module antidote protein, HigA family [Candidatus Lambdaproteobacteria bacterium RIFOXYD2_FULL_56_26]OGH07402.1 MAG: addiction module antidote protein, HigA family [Candidatus Lambdaproteobacteria bacterium RIFOXYD1_FULL_56_27]